MAEAAIPIRPELIVQGDFSQASGYQGMRTLLALDERPSAVFVASDTMAAGALRALHEAGIDVPGDVG